jgi:aminodeoxyfutalosine synthase
VSLKRIENKVFSGSRLTPDDALRLFQSDDIFTMGRLASYAASIKNGNHVYFIRNRHINPTNICVNRCRFCAFSRSKGERGAYELTIKEIIRKLRSQSPQATRRGGKSEIRSQRPRGGNQKRSLHSIPRTSKRVGVKSLRPKSSHDSESRKGTLSNLDFTSSNPHFTEVHIVGGLHPDWPFEYYTHLVSEIRRSFPSIHIKAFTAVEIDHLSGVSGLGITETLLRLKESGLDSMPGGGAEILNRRVRQKICPEKIDGNRWLEIMKKAHEAGIRSNATMLYGHIESYRNRVEHLNRIRNLQDGTGGFQAFIPLAFHPGNTSIEGRYYTSGIDDLKTIAISRLFLDNFGHIKAYWVMLGEKIAQLALLVGADDLDGTIVEEKITRSAGALSGSSMTRSELVNLIRRAGRIPVERDSYYNSL